MNYVKRFGTRADITWCEIESGHKRKFTCGTIIAQITNKRANDGTNHHWLSCFFEKYFLVIFSAIKVNKTKRNSANSKQIKGEIRLCYIREVDSATVWRWVTAGGVFKRKKPC